MGIKKNKQTNPEKESPSWEATSALATQEIPRILQKSKVRYPVNKSPATCPYPKSDKFSPIPPAFL
jgi:hypothetical protein